MHHVDTGEAMVTSNKILTFFAGHPEAYPGVCACIPICVDKFDMDTGHTLVTINRI